MQIGRRFLAHPTPHQQEVLSQWMGCSKTIWNAKVQEEKYLRTYAKKYLPMGTYAPIDQTCSQYKDKELTPWLYQCPSQILRNSATHWYQTYQKFLRGECGKPKLKKKGERQSVHLTRELFQFIQCEDGNTRLWIGTKTNFMGYLSFKKHRNFKEPNSLRIKKEKGKYYLTFSSENMVTPKTREEHFGKLKTLIKSDLEKITIGIDRGVVRPIQAGEKVFDFTKEQKRNKERHQIRLKRFQRKLSRQRKGSKRREKTKLRVAKTHEKIAQIRKDFTHKTSRALVHDPQNQVFILEDLKTSRMTRKPKAQLNPNGKGWLKNKAKAKAGLNKAILDKGWNQFKIYLEYKALRKNKVVFLLNPYNSSLECANCHHTHPDHRKTQSKFQCLQCGYEANADYNAQAVLAYRGINLIQNSGTELSKSGRLFDTGQEAHRKTRFAQNRAEGNELSKKKSIAAITA